MSSSEARPLGTAKCPWCAQEIRVALPLLEPPPESVKVTRPARFAATWLARLIEEGAVRRAATRSESGGTEGSGNDYAAAEHAGLMRIAKPIAVLIGILTAWPIVYILGFMAFIFNSFHRVPAVRDPRAVFQSFQVLMIFHFGTMLIIAALVTFYIVHVFKSSALLGQKQALWAVVLLLGSVIAMPVYWYLYVWREATRGDSVPPRPPSASAV